MKILSLDLLAYGPFTGLSLDLSGGREGLHLIYGPNEAGKSAALRALRGLLYGIPVRTADNFLHDNRALRVGGRLRASDGKELSFRRRKGARNTLLDPGEEPLPDSVLDPFLGGVGEEAFATMFGIRHEDLVRGGQELAAGGGEAGESLFAAALGAGGLHRVLAELEGEADALFKPRASTRVLNQDLGSFQELGREAERLSLSGREWAEHRRALEGARAERREVGERLRRAGAERNRLDRIREALPAIGERRELLRQRELLGQVRLLRPDFGEEHRALLAERQRLERVARDAEGERHVLEDRLAALEPPASLLEQEAAVTELLQGLESHRSLVQAIPALEAEVERVRADARSLLRELRPGLDLEGDRREVEAMRFTAAQRARVLNLARSHPLLVQAREAATRAAAALEARGRRLAEELGSLESAPEVEGLRTAWERAQGLGEAEADLADARLELAAREEEAAAALARLPRWTGGRERLEALALPPPPALDRFEGELAAAAEAVARAEEASGQARKRAAEAERQLGALSLAGEVPTETDLLEARRRREQGWELVRLAWLEGREDPGDVETYDPTRPLPEAYELAVTAADGVADRLRRETERVTRQAALLADREAAHREEADLGVELERLRSARDAVEEEWRGLWARAGIDPAGPREMRAWTRQAEEVVRLSGESRRQGLAVARSEARVAACRDQLARELGVEGGSAGASLAGLREMARSRLRAADELRRRREELERSRQEAATELSRAAIERRTREEELEGWTRAWGEAMADLGLEASAVPAEANAFLERSEALFRKLDEAAGLDRRIAAARGDLDRYAARVRGTAQLVAAEVPEAAGEVPAAEAVQRLHRRLLSAREDAASRRQVARRLEEVAATVEGARQGLAAAAERLDGLCREAGCTDWEKLEELERRSREARDLETRRAQSEMLILGQGGGATLEEFLETAAGVDPDLLPERLRELGEEIRTLEERCSALDQAIGREETELRRMDGGDAAATTAERAQGVLARVREGAERYVRLRLASAILHREIERYRVRNQGPVLRRASELFARLTLGSFGGVRTEYDERDAPFLVGERPSGAGVGVEGMSDGTRDQLYLALRLATLEGHLAAGEPLPFVLDDILINFDDERSLATLEVLAELSVRTQVIFFTHHEHLVEVARRAVGEDSLFVHPLGAPSAGLNAVGEP